MKMYLRYRLPLPRCARTFKLGAATILLALAATQPIPAATVVLQGGLNGYTGATDTWLDESARHDNCGASTNVTIRLNVNTVGYVDDCALFKFTLPVLSFDSVSAATLGLYYYKAGSFYNNNAQGIKPYRVSATKPWYENNRDGQSGEGASWLYYGQAETEGNKWSYGSDPDYGPWYDRIDDGNGENYVKEAGGNPLQKTNAIAPPNWVPFDVLPSVQQWHGGQANNGFIVYSCFFEGGGNTLYSEYTTRECTSQSLRPRLSLSYSGARISWGGTASATWDTITSNWNVGDYRGTYGNGDHVTFADGASNPGISVTAAGVSPGSVTINNTGTIYSFSGGSINGSGPLTKQGAGQATLSASNGYSGQTLVKVGALVVAANNALGTVGNGTVVSNGAALGFQGGVTYSTAEPVTISGSGGGGGALYAVSGNNTFTGPVTLAAHSTVGAASGLELALNGAISGGFDLTKTGGGRLTLAGLGNTYSGATLVNQGTLALGALGSIPNSPVIDVAAGATFDVLAVPGGFNLGATGEQTLKGSGIVAGSVAAKDLARLEPGDSPGTLTFLNDLSLAAGVTNYFELTNSPAIGGGTNDLMVVAGNLALKSNVIAITVLGPDPLGAGSYRLFDYAGAKTGFFSPTPVFLSGAPGPGSTATIDESVTNQINLLVVVPIGTTTLASSAPNPSLPGSNVSLAATVSANLVGTNLPTGSVTFETNGVPLSPPVPLVSGVATMSTSNLPHGFTQVWAEYPGQGLFLGSTGSVVHLVNTPPRPGSHVAYGMQNEPVALPLATLLGHDSDPDHDPLTIIAVSRLSTNGGTAALTHGTNITYLPKPDFTGNDLLTYTLSDSYTNVSVPICLSVLTYGDLSNSIVGITNLGGGAVTITCTGIPGRSYWTKVATNLWAPIYWSTLSTNLADTNGLWQCLDSSATNTEKYYRTATQTNPPNFRLFDAELLSVDIFGGGLPPVMRVRESPTLPTLGITRIRPEPDGSFTICSFFDVFTELSIDNGITWSPATNGSIPLLLVGGTPPNGFPANTLPPLAGQYITPPGWPEFYALPAGPTIVIRDITLDSFTMTLPPPPPGMSSNYRLGALANLFVSWDGGNTFVSFSASAQVQMLIKGRMSGP